MTVTFVLLMGKTMSAEMDRLNQNLSNLDMAVSEVGSKVGQLIDIVRNLPAGEDTAAVAEAANRVEVAFNSLQNINAQQV